MISWIDYIKFFIRTDTLLTLPENIFLLIDLVGKTWTAHKVTPLHNFSYDKQLLRKYGRQLGAYIVAVSGHDFERGFPNQV